MALVPDDCSRTYEVLRPLGTGGFGIVFLAKHKHLGSQVALKVLKHEMVLDQEQRQRFMDEARVTAQLSDPHVVKVLDHGVADVPWIAYEYLPGRTVRDIIATGRMRWRDALRLGAQVAAALEAAHGAGVIHRDIKAENVLEASPGHYKVADFGIARWAGSQVRTQTGFVIGSPTHMAPEVWNGRPAGVKSDVYALGVLLYELLVGKLPFEGKNVGELLQAHMDSHPDTPGRVQPDVPPEVSDLVKRALAREPEDRFELASQVREALERLSEAAPVPRSRPGVGLGSRAGASRAAAGMPSRPDRGRSALSTASGTAIVPLVPGGARATRWIFSVFGAGAVLALALAGFQYARPRPVASPLPVVSASVKAPVEAAPKVDTAQLIESLRALSAGSARAFHIAIEDQGSWLDVGGDVRPVKNPEQVLRVVEACVEPLERKLLEARTLQPGPAWAVIAVLTMDTLRCINLLKPSQRPTTLLESLRRISMVTSSGSADPFRSAFDAVVKARIESLMKGDPTGPPNVAGKLAWAGERLDSLRDAEWGEAYPMRAYTLLRFAQLEVEQRQSSYKHLGTLDVASAPLVKARGRAARHARTVMEQYETKRAGGWEREELSAMVEFYMQSGKMLGAARDTREQDYLKKLASDLWRLLANAPLDENGRARVRRMHDELEPERLH